jgi:hypothetical protein
MKKAHAQIDAAKKERAQATEKALNMLKGELTDDQLKQLQRHIEALRAQKGLGEVERVQAGKLAEEARALQDKAQAAVKLHQLQIERGMVPQGFGGALNLHDGQTTFMAMSHGSRLGAQVKKPSADLADQLDLPKDQGLVIVEVMKESAAAKAGLKANDIILELAGKPVSSDPGAFLRFVRELKGNEEVPAIVLRKGHKEKVTVKVPEPKKDGPVMDWQEGGLKKDFEFTPAIKPDGSGNFRWKIENARGPTAKAAKRDDGEKPVKIEKKEARQSRSVSIQVTDGKFVAEQKEDDVAIRATGTVNGDKMEMNEVTIVSPDGKAVYKKVADVPAKYRDSVKRLLSNTDGSPVRAKAVIIDK